jgi:hypothetical protein
MSHREFLTLLCHARYVITTPGLTATTEAFSQGIACAFLPPVSLSHWCNLKALHDTGAARSHLSWEDLGICSSGFDDLEEQDSGKTFSNVAERVWEDYSLRKRAVDGIAALISTVPDKTGQERLIGEIGIQGAEVICSRLDQAWGLGFLSTPSEEVEGDLEHNYGVCNG